MSLTSFYSVFRSSGFLSILTFFSLWEPESELFLFTDSIFTEIGCSIFIRHLKREIKHENFSEKDMITV